MKKKIREQEQKKRVLLGAVLRDSASAQIEKRLFALREFSAAQSVAFFVSRGEEVCTHSMILKAIAAGKKVFVPKVDGKRMLFFEIPSLEVLSKGPFGIPEPPAKNKNPVSLEHIEIIVVPGIAFDLQGNRIGSGHGYYDRLLAKAGRKTIAIGLCFEANLLDRIPREAHDKPVQVIITEKRTIQVP